MRQIWQKICYWRKFVRGLLKGNSLFYLLVYVLVKVQPKAKKDSGDGKLPANHSLSEL